MVSVNNEVTQNVVHRFPTWMWPIWSMADMDISCGRYDIFVANMVVADIAITPMCYLCGQYRLCCLLNACHRVTVTYRHTDATDSPMFTVAPIMPMFDVRCANQPPNLGFGQLESSTNPNPEP